MKRTYVLAAVAALAAGSVANADFVLQKGNAAYTMGAFSPTFFSFSNTTPAHDYTANSSAIQARGNLWTDVSNYAGNSSAYGSSSLRSFIWGFRNAGGTNGGTAGRGLSSGAGGVTYSQSYVSGASTATATYTDAFQSSRSRITATLAYELFDSATPGVSAVRCVATFKNNAATTETYDFMLGVDSQILGIATGLNDSVTTSIDVAKGQNSIKFSDTVSGNPYFINFVSNTPTFWEVGNGASTGMGNKFVSGASANPTNFAVAGSSNVGVSTFTAGTQDPFGAFQYRTTLAPNATYTVTSYIFVNSDITIIPEPSALGLLAPAAMLLGRRRRA